MPSPDLYKKRLEALFSDVPPAPPPEPAEPEPAPAALPAPPAAVNAAPVNGLQPARRAPAEPAPRADDRFFELSQELLAVIDAAGRFQRLNPSFEAALGWTSATLAPFTFLELVHAADQPATQAELEKLQHGAPVVRVAHRFRCQAGPDRWISWLIQAAPEGGRLLSGYDITERRQAEEALRESEAQYRSLIETSHDAVISVGSDGHFIFYNQVWLAWLGYTAAELTALTLFELMEPASLAHCQPLFWQLMTGQPLQQVEVTFVTKSGARRTLEGNSTPRWSEGRVVASQSIFRDVTARKQIEAELHKFRYALDRSTDAVFLTDTQGVIQYVNAAFTQTYGYTAEEALGQTPRLLKSGLATPEYYTHLWHTLLDKQPLNVALTNKTKDGRLIPIEGGNTPILDEAGAVVGFMAIQRDVTERRQADAELHKFRYALDHSTDAVFLTDTQGVIQYVNPAFTQTYGYTAEDALGQTPRLLKSGLSSAEQYAYFWQALLGKQPVAGEITNKTKDGRLIPIDGANTPILDEAGAIVGFMAAHRDITERKQTEARLQRQATVLDAAANAIVITNPHGTIEWVNAAFTQLTGYTFEEAVGGNPRLLKSGVHDPVFYQGLWGAIKAGEVWRGEVTNRRKDGRLYNEEMTITPVKDERGGLLYFIAIKQDITARKQVERELTRHTAELEALNHIGRTLTSQANPASLLRQVGDQMLEIFNARGGFIAVYDPETGQIAWPYMRDVGVLEENVPPQPLGRGPTSYVIHERRPLVVNRDIYQRMAELGADTPAVPEGEVEKAWLGVPIIVGETVIGALNVNQSYEDAFTEDDVRLLTTIAANLGSAFQTARLLEQVQGRVAELAALNNIVGAAAGSLDPRQILDVAAREAARLVGARSCGVALLTPDKQALTVVAESGEPGRPGSVGLVLPLAGNASSEQALTTRRTVNIADAQTDPLTAPIHYLMRARQTHALVIVPLLARNTAIGTIALDSADPQRAFTEHEISILETIARQLAGAVENARLFEEARKRAAELATVSEVGTAISTLREPEAMLQAVVDLTKARFALYHAHIYLLNAEGDTLVLTAGAGEIGRQMVAEGRRIPYDRRQSLVAQAARTRRAVLVNDVTLDPNFLPHPLLPQTRSELAAPLLAGGQLLGVLDVQAAEVGRFTEVDANIQTALAAQVAVALENARSFANSEKALAELNALARRLSHQSWSQYLNHQAEAQAFIYDRREVQPLQAAPAAAAEGLRHALQVQGEAIGQLSVAEPALPETEAEAILSAVAERLSAHLENLRLTEQTMQSLSRQEHLSTQLETVAQVSTVASTILESQVLLQSVVDLTRERFGLYHAQVYLYDNVSDTLNLAAGSGETGRRMVEAGQILSALLERSAVARAAREREAVLVPELRADDDQTLAWYLPAARAALAVPMLVGERLLGVFHFLADQPGAFTEEDARIQTTLAAQVAIALQNANLYAEQAATVARLKELDQLKSSFLANMSHELRTPLNSILGFTDVILEGLDGALTDRMETDLKVVQKNGQHLLKLINDVLDMAKIEAGRMSISPELVDLNDLVAEVLEITGSLAREKALAVRAALPADESLLIEADHIRLRQVLINLVGNSIKFTETGGVTITAQRGAEHVLVCVQDTGLGIPAAKLENIFEAFSQVDTSTTRKAGGTGLGLPISRRLIELHGGRLWAESRGVPGEGSRFYIELPLKFRYPVAEAAA